MANITINTKRLQQFSLKAGTKNGANYFRLHSSVEQSYSYTVNGGNPIVVSSINKIANINIESNTEYEILNIIITVINGGSLDQINIFDSNNSFCFVEITTTELNKLINLFRLNLSNNIKNNIIGSISSLNSSIITATIPNSLVGSISDFNVNITTLNLFNCDTNKIITGLWSDLPANLIVLGCYVPFGFVQISGNTSLLPDSLKLLAGIYGEAFTLDLNTLPSTIDAISFSNSGTPNINIIGNITNIPNTLRVFRVENLTSCTITGDIQNLSTSLTNWEIFSANCTNTLTGDIQNFPIGLQVFNVRGNNTISGDVSNINSAMASFTIDGNNTITGLIQNYAGILNRVNIMGNNTISGDLGLLNRGFTSLIITGNNTISNFTFPNLNDFLSSVAFRFQIQGNNSLSSTDVDNLLIHMDDVLFVTNSITITILGNSGVRTSASDIAFTNLTNKGYNLTLNT